jgi:hypothetical protein
MTQSQLDQAVARATGESINTIRNYGFSPLYIPQVAYGPGDGSNQQSGSAQPRSDRACQVQRQHRKAA